MKNYFVYILLFSAFSCTHLYGQHTISGKVTDNNNQALEFCNALLLNAIDSSLLNGVVCDAEGKFLIPNVKSGEYLMAYSFIGFETTYKAIASRRFYAFTSKKNIVPLRFCWRV